MSNNMLLLSSLSVHLQDKKVKGKIDARNSLETYVYNIKSSVEDKLKGKISEDEAEKVKKAIADTVEWLDENSDAEQVSEPSYVHFWGVLSDFACCFCLSVKPHAHRKTHTP